MGSMFRNIFGGKNESEIPSPAGNPPASPPLIDPQVLPPILPPPAPPAEAVALPSGVRDFNKTKARVSNRGNPPSSFLNELLDWALIAKSEIFEYNDREDVYSSTADSLGPFTSLIDRRAKMCEILRVEAGFESSWNWQEGRDTSNSTSNTPFTEEAGIFQASANSMVFDKSLQKLFEEYSGMTYSSTNPEVGRRFITLSKENHRYAIEHTARLLRFAGGVAHFGPVKRKEINPWLSREAAAEFGYYLTGVNAKVVDQTPVVPPVSTDTSETPWMEWMQRRLGWTEFDHDKELSQYWALSGIPEYDTVIGSEHAWCALTINAALNSGGYQGTGSAAAASFAEYGTKCEYKFGAILAIRHASGGHHVTCFVRWEDKDRMRAVCRGGNQNNSINETVFTLSGNSQGHDEVMTTPRWPVV